MISTNVRYAVRGVDVADRHTAAATSPATSPPGSDALTALTALDPVALSPSDLVDAVIASERLIGHVNGLQVRLLAELGRPHRCGDVTALVAALVEKTGFGRGPDGQIDADEVAALTADRSIGVAAAELAAVLDWSPVTARIRITQSARMVSALPATADALQMGRIDVGRARMIVDRTAVLAPELCGGIERRILPLVSGRSKARLETLVDREVIAADPAAAENRRRAAIEDRNVTHRPDKDGMGVINALLPAESAVLVFTLIDLIATANKGLDDRSVDQRRADAIADIADELLTYGFVDLEGLVARTRRTTAHHSTPDAAVDVAAPEAAAPAAGAPPAGAPPAGAAGVAAPEPAAPSAEPAAPSAAAGCVGVGARDRATTDVAPRPTAATGGIATVDADPVDRTGRLARAGTRHGRRPHLAVTGAWTTLAGLDDLPGHLDGHGTITAELFRAISTSWGTLTAVGVDPATGAATAVGGLTYRASQRVSDQVITLSGTCRAAGCRMPAAKCDLDHVEAFDHADPAAGGRTAVFNQLPECRFHHLLKHHTEWTPHLRSDMTVVWTTNTGHTATSHPREFTMPGEWERAGRGAAPCDGSGSVDQLEPGAVRPATGRLPSPGNRTARAGPASPPPACGCGSLSNGRLDGSTGCSAAGCSAAGCTGIRRRVPGGSGSHRPDHPGGPGRRRLRGAAHRARGSGHRSEPRQCGDSCLSNSSCRSSA